MFEIGDKVRIKSGGPVMTVENIGDYTLYNPGAKCVWFDDKKKLQDSVFDVKVLEKV